MARRSSPLQLVECRQSRHPKRVRHRANQAAENVGIPVYTEGVDYAGIDASQTDAFGDTCVEFKQGGAARLEGRQRCPRVSYSLDITGGGDAASCAGGGGGCSSVVIDIPPRTCVSGTITRNGIGLGGVWVNLSWGTGESSISISNPDGSFCSAAPVGVGVLVYANYITPYTRVFLSGTTTTTTSVDPGVCSLGESCTSVGTLELVVPAQYCLEGVVENRDDPVTTTDVPPGIPVTHSALRASPPWTVRCNQRRGATLLRKEPWAQPDATASPFPSAKDTRNVIFAVDSCDVGAVRTDLPRKDCVTTTTPICSLR